MESKFWILDINFKKNIDLMMWLPTVAHDLVLSPPVSTPDPTTRRQLSGSLIRRRRFGRRLADVAFSFGLLFFTLALAGPVRISSTASVVSPSPTYLERAKNAKASMQDGGGVLAPSASSCDHVLIFNFLKRNIAIKK